MVTTNYPFLFVINNLIHTYLIYRAKINVNLRVCYIMEIKHASSCITFYFIGGANLPKAEFLEGRFDEGQFGRGSIYQAPIGEHVIYPA